MTHELAELLMYVRRDSAERHYQQSVADFEAQLAKDEERFDAKLRVPALNAEIGLPEVLPESAIEILRRTRSLDKNGRWRPNRARIYAAHGVERVAPVLLDAEERAQ